MLGIVALEIKKILFYRGDLLVRILWATVVRILLGYYLWASIFAARGEQVIQGFSFDQMMLYYLVAALTANAVLVPVGLVSREVYDGSLTKYLVFPVHYLVIRAGAALANCCVGALQLLIGLVVWRIGFGGGGFDEIGIGSLTIGLGIMFLASILYFCIASTIELLALWVEQAHSLSLMVLFLVNLLGGIFLPISVFPEWAQSALYWTPFPYLVFFPAEIVRGAISGVAILRGGIVMVTWIAALSLVGRAMWRRGSYHYAGVGM